jgi:hypothetical protein
LNAARIFCALAALASIAALAWQLRAARGGGRVDRSVAAGDPARGVRYAFTVAMLPRHKETVRLHPLEFTLGLLLHAGALPALLGAALAAAAPGAGLAVLAALRPLFALALVSGLALLARRVFSTRLRALSIPDDYLAIAATCGLLACAWRGSAPLRLAYAGALFLYLPLGKLRHAVFFFAARGDLGRRLGRRGVYPAPRIGRERAHGVPS